MTARTEAARSSDLAPRLGPLAQYALLAGPLLSMLDSSVVNVAVGRSPASARPADRRAVDAVSGYLLALGAGLAGTAYLARRFGTLPVYRASAIALSRRLRAAAPAVRTRRWRGASATRAGGAARPRARPDR